MCGVDVAGSSAAPLYHDTGFKALLHPVVGDLDLTFGGMDLPADTGQSLIVYGAEPGSSTAEALRLLSIWAAANEQDAKAKAGLDV